MDLDRDVYIRTLTFDVVWHSGWPGDLRMHITVRENGHQKRAEETERLQLDAVDHLAQRIVQELDTFAWCNGDMGVRSLF